MNAHLIVGSLLLGFIVSPLFAQHCPGITESYLSEISVKRTGESIKVAAEYCKSGGRVKERYQAYLLAYFAKDAGKIFNEGPNETINIEVATVLHTQLIERNEEGSYLLEFAVPEIELAKIMIRHDQLIHRDKMQMLPGGVFKERFRIAIFIPFLEDTKYSVIKGLPEDKHECNYSRDQALLFQDLPYEVAIHHYPEQKLGLNFNGLKSARMPKP